MRSCDDTHKSRPHVGGITRVRGGTDAHVQWQHLRDVLRGHQVRAGASSREEMQLRHQKVTQQLTNLVHCCDVRRSAGNTQPIRGSELAEWHSRHSERVSCGRLALPREQQRTPRGGFRSSAVDDLETQQQRLSTSRVGNELSEQCALHFSIAHGGPCVPSAVARNGAGAHASKCGKRRRVCLSVSREAADQRRHRCCSTRCCAGLLSQKWQCVRISTGTDGKQHVCEGRNVLLFSPCTQLRLARVSHAWPSTGHLRK